MPQSFAVVKVVKKSDKSTPKGAGKKRSPVCSGGILQSLRQHPVLGLEILAGIGNELAVAGVIHGFDTNHPFHDIVVVRMDMLDQFELGLPGPDNQDFRGAAQGIHDLVIVVLVFGLTTAADRAPLALQVAGRVGRLDHRFLNVIRADVHDACFVVVEPDDRMVMGHDFLSRVNDEPVIEFTLRRTLKNARAWPEPLPHHAYFPASASCSRIAGFSRVETSWVISSPLAIARSRRRMILPERVVGRLSPKRISSGLAIGPIFLATQSRRSATIFRASPPGGRAPFKHTETTHHA